jgi:hypothetical protein
MMPIKNKLPSASQVREIFQYDPLTGLFTWKAKTAKNVIVGKRAGWLTDQGYVVIHVLGKRFKAHSIAWLYMTGTAPAHIIDHIDGNPANNRFDNLREATLSQNQYNRTRRRTKNLKGVRPYNNTGKWKSYIRVGGKQHSLGVYDTPEEAHKAYCSKALELYGPFFNPG